MSKSLDSEMWTSTLSEGISVRFLIISWEERRSFMCVYLTGGRNTSHVMRYSFLRVCYSLLGPICIFNDVFLSKTLLHAVDCEHCGKVAMMFLQHIPLTDEKVEMSLFGFDPRIRVNDHKKSLFPLPGVAFRLVLENGTENFVRETRYSPVLAHTTVLRSSDVD